MLTFTLYNATTGDLGPIISSTSVDEIVIPEGYKPLLGEFEIKGKRLNLTTMEFEDKPPPPPRIGQLRDKRNRLLDNWRWTVMPDSPLSNQDEWLVYLKALQCLLKDTTADTTADVVWPDQPELIYA